MSDLGDIRNFGPYLVGIMHRIGIRSRAQLMGTDYPTIRDALKAQGIHPHPNIFYSIEMGLQGRAWNSITPDERREVRQILDGG